MTKNLVMKIDVSDLTQDQIDSLTASLWAQTEAYSDYYRGEGEPDRSYPDLTVVSCDVMAV